MRRAAIALVMLCILAGCAGTTTMTARRWVPAKYDIIDLHTLALDPFTGYESEDEAAANLLTSAVVRRLHRDHFFQVAPITRESHTSPDISWKAVWKEHGAQVGADAVLGGDIDLADIRSTADPTRVRGALVVMLRLFDIRSEKLRGGGRLIVQKTFEHDGPVTSDDRREMLAELAVDMSDRIARQITPSITEQRLKLMRDSLGKEGMMFAKRDQWALAINAWFQTITDHPSDSAAFYNIGAAYEFLELYDTAILYYERAQSIRPTKLTADAIERIPRLIEEKQKQQDRLEVHQLQSPSKKQHDHKTNTQHFTNTK
ncbi:MAG: tetratricopeptide repeat protein [Deltaproteobacteria bacterium]|nr:tetratricopeptide repeat protein [Deltaproteobacteria bacterium]